MDLSIFLNPNDQREFARVPFCIGVHSFFNNGDVMVRVGKMDGHSDIDSLEVSPTYREGVLKYFRTFDECDGSGYVQLPTPPEWVEKTCKPCDGIGKAQICGECDGLGEVKLSNDFNQYRCDCKTCDGAGEHSITNPDLKGLKTQPCSECWGAGKLVTNLSEVESVCGGLMKLTIMHKIATLKNVKIRLMGTHFAFKFDGGVGVAGRSY